MAELEVPPYFLCPITLEIMKDPVTVSTGITYDRESIEKWIFSSKNSICPVTKLPLSDAAELTPNIILRRMIHSWSVAVGVDSLPAPQPPVTKSQILRIFAEAEDPDKRIGCLQRLKAIASSENQRDRRIMEAGGVCDFLETLIVSGACEEDISEGKITFELGLGILNNLQLSESSLKSLVSDEFLHSLTRILQFGSHESRIQTVTLLKSMLQVSDPDPLISLKPEFFKGLTLTLRNQITEKVSGAILRVLILVSPVGRNRIKAVDAGAVKILIDLLRDNSSDRRFTEKTLILLDLLCQCADGRAALLEHGGAAVVSRKILRVSCTGNERAVRILHSMAKYSASPAVLAEFLQNGVVAKLCLVLHVDCGSKARERAREILVLHARAWRDSPCIPKNLLPLYPIS